LAHRDGKDESPRSGRTPDWRSPFGGRAKAARPLIRTIRAADPAVAPDAIGR